MLLQTAANGPCIKLCAFFLDHSVLFTTPADILLVQKHKRDYVYLWLELFQENNSSWNTEAGHVEFSDSQS